MSALRTRIRAYLIGRSLRGASQGGGVTACAYSVVNRCPEDRLKRTAKAPLAVWAILRDEFL